MTVGYRIAAGTDLDAVFKARTSAAAAATGFKDSAGVDLSNRYEPRGSTLARADVGYRIASGVDLAQIFKDINTSSVPGTTNNMLAKQSSPGDEVAGPEYGFSEGFIAPYLTGSTMTPAAIGAWTISTIKYRSASAGTLFVTLRGASTPPDTNATWNTLYITGIFSDSGGVSVTRTFLRSARSSYLTFTQAGIYLSAWWRFDGGTQPKFIPNNTYAIAFTQG